LCLGGGRRCCFFPSEYPPPVSVGAVAPVGETVKATRDAMRLRPVNNSATAQNLGIALCQPINIPGGSPPSDLVLGVKDGILTVDLPHEFRAKFDSLFELPFGLAL